MKFLDKISTNSTLVVQIERLSECVKEKFEKWSLLALGSILPTSFPA
jgi:hypothetical protein